MSKNGGMKNGKLQNWLRKEKLYILDGVQIYYALQENNSQIALELPHILKLGILLYLSYSNKVPCWCWSSNAISEYSFIIENYYESSIY